MTSLTKKIALLGIITAANVVIARTFLIPIPFTHGNINLCDAGIVLAALLFGSRAGGVVGALSGLLLDLISGYPQYMFFSLLAHGTEGYIIGRLGQKRQWLGLLVGTLVMVTVYFGADSFLYTVPTGLVGIPLNLLQGVIGVSVGYLLVVGLNKRLAFWI